MAKLFRTRVVAVGTEADMLRLNRALLDNLDIIDDDDDDEGVATPPPATLEEIYAQLREYARYEGGQDDSFLYGMITTTPFGEADEGSCRYVLQKQPCGLWTASFAYESSSTPFQPEDWLRLHQKCDRIPMLALRAGWDFGLDKGMTLITGGRVHDDWDRMAESWLWLMHQYEFGYPPEEAVQRLRKLEVTFEREDFDMSVEELLDSCIENLQQLGDTEDISPDALQQLWRNREFAELFTMMARVAETALWETEHNARWIACLEAVRDAWLAAQD